MEHNTEHNITSPRSSLRRRVGLVAAGLALAVPVVGLASYGIAGAGSAEDSPDEGTEECGAPTPEDVAASNEEENELAAFLDERGIRYTREPDADGSRWVAWDENDEAANDAVEEFWAERYPMSPEDLAAGNAEQEALARFLDERGIRFTRDTGPDGVSYVEWDMSDEAANVAVADFYAERYPAAELAEELGAQAESASCVGMIEVGPG